MSPTSDHVTPHQQLLEKIRVRSATVGVIGLGYVDLPLALLFEQSTFPVIGFDPKKPEALGRGESYIRHIGPERVARAVANGRISATSDLGLESVPCTADEFGRYDALVVDTRNVLSKRGDDPHDQSPGAPRLAGKQGSLGRGGVFGPTHTLRTPRLT